MTDLYIRVSLTDDTTTTEASATLDTLSAAENPGMVADYLDMLADRVTRALGLPVFTAGSATPAPPEGTDLQSLMEAVRAFMGAEDAEAFKRQIARAGDVTASLDMLRNRVTYVRDAVRQYADALGSIDAAEPREQAATFAAALDEHLARLGA